MTMEGHISTVVRSVNIHIRRIGNISKYLTRNDTETLDHTFVTSRLDHLNGQRSQRVPKKLIFRLQQIQNTAARLVTRSKSSSHITPVLQSLHWLPEEKRIQYKILLLTYKCLHARAPTYLSDLLTCRKNLRKLRSSAKGPFLEQPTSRLHTVGDRAFSVAASQLWNELPFELRNYKTVETFKGLLKSHLFRKAYGC